MRYLAILLAVMMIGTIAMAQGGGNPTNIFTPLSLSTTGVGALSARTTSTTYADTTKGFDVQTYSNTYYVIKETISDTLNLHLYYRGSIDGVTYPVDWTYADSINWKPTNNGLFQWCVDLTSKVGGFKTVQVKVHCPGTVPLGVTTTGTTYPKVTHYVVQKFKR